MQISDTKVMKRIEKTTPTTRDLKPENSNHLTVKKKSLQSHFITLLHPNLLPLKRNPFRVVISQTATKNVTRPLLMHFYKAQDCKVSKIIKYF